MNNRFFAMNPDAKEILDFLRDAKVWSKHKSYYFSGNFPQGISKMRHRIEAHPSDFDDMLRAGLWYIAKQQLESVEHVDILMTPLFPPKNSFVIDFYIACFQAHNLKDIVNWIREAKTTGAAYQQTDSKDERTTVAKTPSR